MATPNTVSARQYGKAFLLRWLLLFVVVFGLPVSLPHPLLPDTGKWLRPLFEKGTGWFATHILHLRLPYIGKIRSDSSGMYVFALLVFLVTGIAAFLWSAFHKKHTGNQKLICALRIFARYYLAMQLLAYGCSKLFKWQFYLPEPNTLFTTIGQAPKDLLLWSTIGTSRLYTVFCGIAEVLAAGLLFFRRTTLAGALTAAGILLNVLAINIAFDILVKLYAAFLLLLSIILISLHGRQLGHFLFTRKTVSGNVLPAVQLPARKQYIYIFLKTTCITLLVTDALWSYLQTRNFNDDAAARPFLHGAYEARGFINNNDTLPPLLTDSLRWRRLFIHRRGYFIIQSMDDHMQDYQLDYDTGQSVLFVQKPGDTTINVLHYRRQGKETLILKGNMHDHSIEVILQQINLEQLPALQPGFHWTMDEE